MCHQGFVVWIYAVTWGTGPRICILGGGFGGLYTALRLDLLMWPSGTKPQVTSSIPAVHGMRTLHLFCQPEAAHMMQWDSWLDADVFDVFVPCYSRRRAHVPMIGTWVHVAMPSLSSTG
jgi:hypothetical protein